MTQHHDSSLSWLLGDSYAWLTVSPAYRTNALLFFFLTSLHFFLLPFSVLLLARPIDREIERCETKRESWDGREWERERDEIGRVRVRDETERWDREIGRDRDREREPGRFVNPWGPDPPLTNSGEPGTNRRPETRNLAMEEPVDPVTRATAKPRSLDPRPVSRTREETRFSMGIFRRLLVWFSVTASDVFRWIYGENLWGNFL